MALFEDLNSSAKKLLIRAFAFLKGKNEKQGKERKKSLAETKNGLNGLFRLFSQRALSASGHLTQWRFTDRLSPKSGPTDSINV